MSDLSTTDVYLITLRIIQPARIQDIENSIPGLFPDTEMDAAFEASVRETHKDLLKRQWVFAVRRGSYCLSRKAMTYTSSLLPSAKLDNRRFFLMKAQRKKLN